MSLKQVACNKSFGGLQKVFTHESKVLKCTMKFGLYLPPEAEVRKVPVVYWLSGLTCTEQNFMTKAGAQQHAAAHNFMMVIPNTSPRGCNIPGEDDSDDFGSGAGFYVDATQEPWKTNYNMYSYITQELPELINSEFPADPERQSIMGHRSRNIRTINIHIHNQLRTINIDVTVKEEEMELHPHSHPKSRKKKSTINENCATSFHWFVRTE